VALAPLERALAELIRQARVARAPLERVAQAPVELIRPARVAQALAELIRQAQVALAPLERVAQAPVELIRPAQVALAPVELKRLNPQELLEEPAQRGPPDPRAVRVQHRQRYLCQLVLR
jgi:hypothetical protein